MENMDKIVTEVARRAVKEFLENLMNTERDVFLMENNGQKNGYYNRSMKTKVGEIKDLNVPRDRDGSFRTAVFEPYSRSIGIDELILALYSKGISTRNSAEIMQTIFRNRYSKSTISTITEATLEEVRRFQERSLDQRYIAIFLDGLSINGGQYRKTIDLYSLSTGLVGFEPTITDLEGRCLIHTRPQAHW